MFFPTFGNTFYWYDEIVNTCSLKRHQALDLKKLQTPLYEEFYNRTLNTMGAPTADATENSENPTHLPNLPLKSRSPKRWPSRRLSAVVDVHNIASPIRETNHVANESIHNRALQEIQSPQLSEWKEFLHDGQQETLTSRFVCHHLMPGLSEICYLRMTFV